MSAGGRNRFAWLAPVGVLALLAAACSGGASPDVPPAAAGDAGTLIEQALDARSADDYDGFVDNLRAAAAQCPDPVAASRLDEVAEIAASWSAASRTRCVEFVDRPETSFCDLPGMMQHFTSRPAFDADVPSTRADVRRVVHPRLPGHPRVGHEAHPGPGHRLPRPVPRRQDAGR
jgi:hypothetical protein